MRSLCAWLLLVLLAAIALVDCQDGGTQNQVDAGTDGDGGADTDSDGDGDTDTGTETETDSWTPPITWPPYQQSPSTTTQDPGYATGAGFADIDGDGRLDLVISNGNDVQPGPLMVYLADVDGDLPDHASWTSTAQAYYGHLALGDVDGDGWIDAVVAVFLGDAGFSEPGGVAFYRNEEGTLAAEPTWMTADPCYTFAVALGDVDNDGDLDLALATGEAYYHAPEPDRLYLNDNGVFQEPAAWVSDDDTFSLDAVFADLNRDGALDLAFARVEGPHAIYYNIGAATTAALPETYPSWEAMGTGFEGNTIDFGDLDGDGWLDLVISNTQQTWGSGLINAYCGPDFEQCWTCGDDPSHRSAVALADLDGDRDLDLATGEWFGPLRFYRNQTEVPGTLALEESSSLVTFTDTVVEAIVFADLDRAESYEEAFEAEGPLVELPRRCRVVESTPSGTVGDGYLTVPGSGSVSVTCELTFAPDLLVSDWTADHGNDLYIHLADQ